MKDDRLLIITGLSGSGKTVTSRFLEDLGYYCVDNLPAKLIPSFIDLWRRKEVGIEKVALVVDIREAGFAEEFPKVLDSIKEKIKPILLFLETSDEVLIKRYSESRRPHPLSGRKSVRESIALERERLAKIKNRADYIIDTSSINISQLKEILTKRFLKRKRLGMQIVIISFGYKFGIPLDSDLVFDTRFLPNPYYIDGLRDKTGRSEKVRRYVLESDETKKYLKEINRFIDYLMPNFRKEGKSYVIISIGCTGGKHRSVVLAEKIKEHLKTNNYKIRVYHRDVYR
ncbi:MAG: RNase adapter RapZ [Candidatus Aminicenantes bacterium]|nr:MAG: RNase adapter RapZ [Candidatus Aminicenantes bacterium]